MNLWNRTLALIIALPFVNGCATTTDTREPVDLVVYGDHIVTMVPGQSPIVDGAVAIRDGLIVAVG
ncbi:MAG: amidohydrolase, partial [Pseudomonadota bacterium]